MHPIEHLRYLARLDGEQDALIATEAAYVLGELASYDPAAVVTASRRLLERHPSCGPLWWSCAHISADGPEGARRATEALGSDQVAFALSRFISREVAHSDVVAAVLPSYCLARAAELEPRLSVHLVGSYSSLRSEMASFTCEATGYETAEAKEALSAATLLFAEARFAGVQALYVGCEAAPVIAAATADGLPIYGILPPGTLLHPTLEKAASIASGSDVVALPPSSLAGVISEAGPEEPRAALSSPSCPPGVELGRLA